MAINLIAQVGFNSYSERNFIFAAGSMYARRYFKPEAKAAMLEMTEYLRKAFTEILDELEWMDGPTKEKARKKLEKMDQFIAYQDEFLDKDLIDGLYDGLEVKEGDFLGNVLRFL